MFIRQASKPAWGIDVWDTPWGLLKFWSAKTATAEKCNGAAPTICYSYTEENIEKEP